MGGHTTQQVQVFGTWFNLADDTKLIPIEQEARKWSSGEESSASDAAEGGSASDASDSSEGIEHLD